MKRLKLQEFLPKIFMLFSPGFDSVYIKGEEKEEEEDEKKATKFAAIPLTFSQKNRFLSSGAVITSFQKKNTQEKGTEQI